MRPCWLVAALALPLSVDAAGAMGCTTMGITPGASADGSSIVTHTADCSTCDTRVARIYPKSWPAGAKRPVYAQRAEYPRYVVPERAVTYEPAEGQQVDVPKGYVPQTEHTHGYWENTYAYMNEHGLAIGESTCAANFVNFDNATMLPIRELTQLAQERCESARCAVKTMGAMAEEFGFYGEDPGRPGAGEALTIADGREVWVFHITGDSTGRGAFWAAQRVPDGHIAVVANNFIIRKVDCSDEEWFLCSTDLLEKVKASGAWDGKGDFDWTGIMAPDIRYFSYTPGFDPIPYYTTARLWRVYSRTANASRAWKLSDNPADFPFSMPVDRPLTIHDVMALQRDHYEGTEIDLTVGAFAGPYGSPNRNQMGVGMKVLGGQFARAISISRTSSALLGQTYARTKGVNKLWVAPDAPASSVFVPFYAQVKSFDEAYRTGHMMEYDDRSAWWVFDFVANWMDLNYRLMSADVNEKIAELQGLIDREREPVEAALVAGGTTEALEALQLRLQRTVVDTWRKFGHFLIMKYNDGFVNHPKQVSIGYPAWWLQMFNLDNNIRPHWGRPNNAPPPLFQAMGQGPYEALPSWWHPGAHLPKSLTYEGGSFTMASGGSWLTAAACVTCLAVGLGAGFLFGRSSKKETGSRVGTSGDSSTPYVRITAP